MPAIQLARLKIQVTDLLTHFDEPAEFLRQLHDLLNFYADRTRRPGRSGKPKPLIQAYNVPQQVMRRIEGDLAPRVTAEPEKALALADQLWADPWFECRLLAIGILGMLPLDAPETITLRLQEWGKTCRENALLDALLETGAASLRAESPDDFLLLVDRWLTNGDLPSRTIGLRALPALVKNPKFENLPTLYRLLSPLLREALSSLESDLLHAVRALGERSPQETAYFLRQNLNAPHKSGLAVIVRRSLDVFPPEMEDLLRTTLRERMHDQSDAG
jgi:hypothetical protein